MTVSLLDILKRLPRNKSNGATISWKEPGLYSGTPTAKGINEAIKQSLAVEELAQQPMASSLYDMSSPQKTNEAASQLRFDKLMMDAGMVSGGISKAVKYSPKLVRGLGEWLTETMLGRAKVSPLAYGKIPGSPAANILLNGLDMNSTPAIEKALDTNFLASKKLVSSFENTLEPLTRGLQNAYPKVTEKVHRYAGGEQSTEGLLEAVRQLEYKQYAKDMRAGLEKIYGKEIPVTRREGWMAAPWDKSKPRNWSSWSATPGWEKDFDTVSQAAQKWGTNIVNEVNQTTPNAMSPLNDFQLEALFRRNSLPNQFVREAKVPVSDVIAIGAPAEGEVILKNKPPMDLMKALWELVRTRGK